MFAFEQAAAFEAKSGHGSEDNLFKDADEPIGVHESEPIILPDALPIALVDESLIIGCDSLFDMLLGTTSGLVSKFLQIRACHSISLGNWTNTGGQKQRLVSYTVPVKKNALGPSEAACIEQYTVNSKQAGSWLVTLLVHTPKKRKRKKRNETKRNEKKQKRKEKTRLDYWAFNIGKLEVPFGDTFHQQLQWACQQEGSGRCRLRVTGQVNFTKACFVKGIIQKASEEVQLLLQHPASPVLCNGTILAGIIIVSVAEGKGGKGEEGEVGGEGRGGEGGEGGEGREGGEGEGRRGGEGRAKKW
ncbi:MAG: hypothetical protein FRX49_06116 [Trebouxia sp. A1-2]|nr:MAG: hypothetical protein FRX49_06116 [Trebouxia sp. A1-2]